MGKFGLLWLAVMCAPMAVASPACVSATLADYINLGPGGCGFDGLTFSNFQYGTSALNATPPLASAITVAPVAGFEDVFGVLDDESHRVYAVGFQFGINTGLGRIEDKSRRLDLDLLYEAASPWGISEAVAFASVGADDLSTGLSYTTIDGKACTYVDGNGVQSNACRFNLTDVVSVDHHVHLSVGPAFPGVGGAGISGVQSGFVSIPEPAGWILCCAPLLVIAGLARAWRRNRGAA